jgi:hypothetical protein
MANESSRAPELVASSVAMLVFAWMAVISRMWVRKFMIRSVGLDDWFMVMALVSP